MASKNIYYRILFKVLLLVITCFGCSYFILQKHIDFAIYVGIILIFQVINLIHFLNTTNRKIAFFFNAIENDDSTISFPTQTKDKSLRDIHKSLNRVNKLIQNVKVKNKTQEKYYHTILEHASIGILTLNDQGHILLANKTAKTLFNYDSLTHVQQLKRVDEKLFRLISQLKPFDQKLIQLPNEREIVQLTIKTNPIKINNEESLLVIIQNISNELNDNEVDSWVKLFRVLTHEIMNTITPITSISQTLSDFYQQENQFISASEITNQDIHTLVNSLNIIKDQGDNLIKFVDSYRTLVKIASPDKEIINLATLYNKIRVLVSQEPGFNNVKFEVHITPKDLEVYADEKQLIHVLINLTKNALQSLYNNSNGVIKLYGKKDKEGKILLQVIDNGPGIGPDFIDQIFIPFFTTKDDGNGIGLSLSKHIMRLHGGSIKVNSIPNEETTFSLIF
ncbi:sensor histidine kinase [Wenyingzhuangia marina]|uniref:histidine kinase n=1 Tax=Wenyingzhuangia marina TaxID=1195760 RepID=A0A1M5WZV1_9FLAO|nr:ATP-binding protein [Wenyingzhuangia marina]GGF82776.1 sensor histidine kinase [Wenyingzhuangia marina]SHH93061.1 Signal transduction histidine kinase, nitrogen specific [Wenyingzhuangia marina]